MSYFFTDIKKIYKSRSVRWMCLLLLVVMIADPLSVYLAYGKSETFIKNIGNHPFMFWLLINSGSWGHRVFFALKLVFPVLSVGLLFYNEYASSAFEYMIVRRNAGFYYISKICAVFLSAFVNFFALLSVNAVVTWAVFRGDAPKTEQYMYRIPQKRSFAYPFYERNPFYEAILYAFLWALTIALLALFVFAVQAVCRFKNQYMVLLIPYVIIYAVKYVEGLLLIGKESHDLNMITQPICANMFTMKSTDAAAAFLGLMFADAILLIAGYIRSRETL